MTETLQRVSGLAAEDLGDLPVLPPGSTANLNIRGWGASHDLGQDHQGDNASGQKEGGDAHEDPGRLSERDVEVITEPSPRELFERLVLPGDGMQIVTENVEIDRTRGMGGRGPCRMANGPTTGIRDTTEPPTARAGGSVVQL